MGKFNTFLIFTIVLFVTCASASAQSNAQIEKEILGHLKNLEKFSERSGTSDIDALDKENRILEKELLRYGQKASILKYDFPALADTMTIATSKDRKLRIYSWDGETGGTGRYSHNVFQYLDKAGRSHTWSSGPRREGEVCTGWYHQIFQTDTPTGRIYLANSTANCSNALASQSLSIFRIDGSKLNSNLRLIKTKSGLKNSVLFEYDFFSVVDHPERPINLFFFDDAKKSFRFPVVLEDPKFLNGGRVTDKFITYRFNGKYFVKVS